jgi:hypothetical protein
MEWMELARTFGIWAAIVVSFLYRDFYREKKLTSRIATLEDETRGVLLPLVKDCAAVITKNTVVMERLDRFLSQ